MEIILLERVENLGTIGDVVKVKDGYARNFLLPKNKALRATEANKKRFDAQKADIFARNAELKVSAEHTAGTLEGQTFVIIRQAGESGLLYGSVAARDIVDAAVAAGHSVPRQAIVLDKPIKTLGIHPVKVRLHAEVSVNVSVNVARSPEEAERQAQGINVVTAALEEERALAEAQAAELAAMSIANEMPDRDE